jgi:hypothetical protein
VAQAGTLFGYGIRSAFSHERLSPAPAQRGTIEIDVCPPVSVGDGIVTHRAVGSGASFTIARERDTSLAVLCSEAGGFRVDATSLLVRSDHPLPGDEIWEHRLVSVVAPLLLAERGDISLHAAAVARDDRAVAFVGASMRGKSTLAVAAGEAGLGVLADDGVVTEPTENGALVWPGPVGGRVARPGEPRKVTLPLGSPPLRPARLAALAILGPWVDGAPELEALTPAGAVPALVPSLIFAGSDRLARALRDAAWLAARVPVVRCRLPYGIDGLPAAALDVFDRLVSPAGA